MELTTYQLKRKVFYYEIKILYPLWGVQPNLENSNQIIINHNRYTHKINFIPRGHGIIYIYIYLA